MNAAITDSELEARLSNLLKKELGDWVLFPSLCHCIGTDRILGTKAPYILREALGLVRENDFRQMQELVSLLRSYVVIDDFLRDTCDIPSRYVEEIHASLEKIQERSEELILRLRGDKSLFEKHKKVAQSAYDSFGEMPISKSVINKCILFYLVFQLPIFLRINDVQEIDYKLRSLLFGLQLMDDIVDIEEDRASPTNHNIYASSLSEENYNIVIDGRWFLLDQAERTFRRILNDCKSIGSSLLKRSIDETIAYLDKKREGRSDTASEMEAAEIVDWNPNYCVSYLKRLNKTRIPTDCFNISDYRAEVVHSGGATDGYRE